MYYMDFSPSAFLYFMFNVFNEVRFVEELAPTLINRLRLKLPVDFLFSEFHLHSDELCFR